jgi:hypothetical protein
MPIVPLVSIFFIVCILQSPRDGTCARVYTINTKSASRYKPRISQQQQQITAQCSKSFDAALLIRVTPFKENFTIAQNDSGDVSSSSGLKRH